MDRTPARILSRFRAALDKIYGERIERVVLYGSRARGDARPDSDYDVAVSLRDLPDRWTEMDRLADLSAGLLDAIPRRLLGRAHAAYARDSHGRHRPLKPEASAFLGRSRECLEKADGMLMRYRGTPFRFVKSFSQYKFLRVGAPMRLPTVRNLG